MCNLLDKEETFKFNEDCLQASKELKAKLVSAPIVRPPNWSLPFEITYDGNDYADGEIFRQCLNKNFHIICYASKTLCDTQRITLLPKKNYLL